MLDINNANEILSKLTPSTGYSYYIFFSNGDTAEYWQSNQKMNIMTHYCDNTSKKYVQFPCMYRPTTYPSYRRYVYSNGSWSSGSTTSTAINQTEQGQGVDATTWLNGLNWICGNTDVIVYDNNTSGIITEVTTLTLTEEIIPDTDPDVYTEIVDFSNENWKTQRTDVFTVSDGDVPFFVDSTFTYNDSPTLRSGQIDHSNTSATTIQVTYVEDGSLEFDYVVSSETNYDKLLIYIDDVQVVNASGSKSWQTYSQSMSAGKHTIMFQYTKDGSAIGGIDSCAIGYIKFIGVAAPFDKKYLIRSRTTSMLYTIVDGQLSELENIELNAEAFQLYGMDSISDASVLSSILNPQIFYWQDADDPLPEMYAIVTATPLSQYILASTIQFDNNDISGVQKVDIKYKGNPLFACNFNNENIWKYFNGTAWVESDSIVGMTAETFTSITTEQWGSTIDNLTSLQIGFVLNDVNDEISSITIFYIKD